MKVVAVIELTSGQYRYPVNHKFTFLETTAIKEINVIENYYPFSIKTTWVVSKRRCRLYRLSLREIDYVIDSPIFSTNRLLQLARSIHNKVSTLSLIEPKSSYVEWEIKKKVINIIDDIVHRREKVDTNNDGFLDIEVNVSMWHGGPFQVKCDLPLVHKFTPIEKKIVKFLYVFWHKNVFVWKVHDDKGVLMNDRMESVGIETDIDNILSLSKALGTKGGLTK